MPQVRYPYFTLPGDTIARPMAPGFVMNPLNQKVIPVVGILDTGADSTTLMPDLMPALGIDPLSLPLVNVGGATGTVQGGGWRCDFLRIALVESPSYEIHLLNGTDPVPVLFSQGLPINLFGRDCFLNRAIAAFDGRHGVVTLDLP